MTSLWPNLGAPVDLGRISELTGLPPCDVPTHHSNPSLFAYNIFMAFNMILPHLLAIPAIFDMVEAMKQAGKKRRGTTSASLKDGDPMVFITAGSN